MRFPVYWSSFFSIFAKRTIMDDDNKNNLEEPAAAYGQKCKLSEIEFQPMPNMMEALRKQGYITHEELVERLSKYL